MQTRLRRFQAAAFIAASLLALSGAHLAGWFSTPALSPSQTLQTATLHAAPAASPQAAVRTSAPAPASAGMASVVRPVRASVTPERARVTPAPAPAPNVTPAVESESERVAAPGDFFAEGTASYYGRELAGRPTASGERFDPNGLTAAHRTLPLGSRIRVTNPSNGKSVVVRVNDRGPFHGNRILDLSHGAARAIGMAARGTGRVIIDLIERGTGRRARRAAEAPSAPLPAADVAPAPVPEGAPEASALPAPVPADSSRR